MSLSFHSGVLVATVTCMVGPVPGSLADVVKVSGDVRFGFRPVLERLRVKQGRRFQGAHCAVAPRLSFRSVGLRLPDSRCAPYRESGSVGEVSRDNVPGVSLIPSGWPSDGTCS